jgi:MFS family permease
MVFGAFLCFPWMLSFLLPALKGEHPEYTSWLFNHNFVYLVIISLSFINGIGEALLWVAQGKYISDCASEYNKGFFYSYFWAYYMSSQIFGNYIAGLVLGKLTQSSYVIMMSVLTLGATLLFIFLGNP